MTKNKKSLVKNLSVLKVAEFSAALQEGILSLAYSDKDRYNALTAANNGFPGIWLLCARAAAILQDELNEAGDPDCSLVDYIEASGQMAHTLFTEQETWTDEQLTEKARAIIDKGIIAFAQNPTFLNALTKELPRLS